MMWEMSKYEMEILLFVCKAAVVLRGLMFRGLNFDDCGTIMRSNFVALQTRRLEKRMTRQNDFLLI